MLDGDLNFNGEFDDPEDITITTPTLSDGQYWLGLVPGIYRVTEEVPVGYFQSTSNPPLLTVPNDPGADDIEFFATVEQRDQFRTDNPGYAGLTEIVPDLAFGNYRPASKSGYKYEDVDGSGTT